MLLPSMRIYNQILNVYFNFLTLTKQLTLICLITVFINGFHNKSDAQETSFFEPLDTFSTKRFYPLAGTGLAVYTGAVIALDQAWYANQPRGRFRFYNDWPEWKQMDKFGHSMTAYYEADVIYKGARWTGMSKTNALISSAAIASALQLTIEVMDGFVETYGFSWYDVAFNTLGVGLFTLQEALWDNQVFVMKFSTRAMAYDRQPIQAINGDHFSSPYKRANDLYGTFFAERWLKDYNGQTYWLSTFPNQFIPEEKRFAPDWLGLSIGYGAGNMFGGQTNRWREGDYIFDLSNTFPRYRSYYLSLDIDLNKLNVKSKFLRSLFSVINFIKIPFPTLEYNRIDGWRGHWLYF